MTNAQSEPNAEPDPDGPLNPDAPDLNLDVEVPASPAETAPDDEDAPEPPD